MLKTSSPLALAALALTAVVAAGCSPTDEADSSTAKDTSNGGATSDAAGAEAGDCSPESLDLIADGVLTIGTDTPAYSPWFVDDNPSNGEGFESAVAYAIAEQLGFSADQVTWVTVPFNKAIQPAPKDFDFDVNQFSISAERAEAVDFSSGYLEVRQTVITNAGSTIDGVTAMADLADAKLGAQVGTTSYDAIVEQIDPSQDVAVFDTNDQAVQALENGQIDGIVVDLGTAYYMTAAQLSDGVIVGQLPAEGEVEEFGAVLDKDSPLTGCVTEAVDALREDGTLDELAATWLEQQGGAPELS